MVIPLALSLLFSLQTLAPTSSIPTPPPPTTTATATTTAAAADPLFLKDVLKAIADRQKWDADKLRVLDLRVRNARLGRSRRYEFRVRAGEQAWVMRFSDEVLSWRRMKRKKGEGGLDALARARSRPVLDEFTLVGPAEISIRGDEEELSLHYPLNTTIMGLKRVLISEGITVSIRGAQQVFLLDLSTLKNPVNKTSSTWLSSSQFQLFPHSCGPLFPVQISGSASLVAYRTSSPMSNVKSIFLSEDTVHLLPDKCYDGHFPTNRKFPVESLNKRLALLELLLSSSVGETIFENQTPSILNGKIAASNVVQFELEMVRQVDRNDAYWSSVAEWRTKPKVERIWYNVVAGVESAKLKPLVLTKLRPFIAVDSVAWSTLTSNVSFTQFPSAIVPPEALTLGLKW